MSYSQTHTTIQRSSPASALPTPSSRQIGGRSSIRSSRADVSPTHRSAIPTLRSRHSNAQSIAESSSSRLTGDSRSQTEQALTTFRHLGEAEVSGSYFVNTTGDVNIHSVSPGQTLSNHRNVAVGSSGNIHPTCGCSNVATPGPSQNAEYDIYYNQLLVKKRGSPLWEPGPQMMFPTEYRRNGVSIGDVGILYRTGDFAFLFNIFLPADHEINEGRVPNGFIPLDKSKVEKSIKKCVVYDRGSCLASSSLRRTDSSDFTFQSTGSEGAVLVMPDGAISEDLRSYKVVEKYVAENAKSWYGYVESDDCGMQTENGDIRVVVGMDKVSSWGMATFENVDIEDPLRFEFKEDERRESQVRTYKWDRIVAGRAGPPEEEIRDLLQEPNTTPLRNQCVFVRALNVSVAGKVRDELAACEIRSSGFRECHSDLDWPGQRNENLQTSEIGLTVSHPSKLLNKYLLEKCPNAEVVITKDSDWMSVITEADATTPSFEDICARVLASHVIREKEGVVTLKKRKRFLGPESAIDPYVFTSLAHQRTTSEDALPMGNENEEYVIGRLFLETPEDRSLTDSLGTLNGAIVEKHLWPDIDDFKPFNSRRSLLLSCDYSASYRKKWMTDTKRASVFEKTPNKSKSYKRICRCEGPGLICNPCLIRSAMSHNSRLERLKDPDDLVGDSLWLKEEDDFRLPCIKELDEIPVASGKLLNHMDDTLLADDEYSVRRDTTGVNNNNQNKTLGQDLFGSRFCPIIPNRAALSIYPHMRAPKEPLVFSDHTIAQENFLSYWPDAEKTALWRRKLDPLLDDVPFCGLQVTVIQEADCPPEAPCQDRMQALIPIEIKRVPLQWHEGPMNDFLPKSGISFHKPSVLWPPPSRDISKLHTSIRTCIKREVRFDEFSPIEQMSTISEEDMSPFDWPTNSGPQTSRDREKIDMKISTGDVEEISGQSHFYTNHPLVSPITGYLGGLPPLLFIAGDDEVLRIIYTIHKAAYPEKYPVHSSCRLLCPHLQDMGKGRTGPTSIHLQVYDGTHHILPVLFTFTTPAKFCFRAIANFDRFVTNTKVSMPMTTTGRSSSSSGGPQMVQKRNAGDPRVYEDIKDRFNWESRMIRERVSTSGIIRDLEPEDELAACKMPHERVGQMSEVTVQRYLETTQRFNQRFGHTTEAIQKKRHCNLAKAETELSRQIALLDQSISQKHNGADRRVLSSSARSWVLDDREDPPPSSIVARRDTKEAIKLAAVGGTRDEDL